MPRREQAIFSWSLPEADYYDVGSSLAVAGPPLFDLSGMYGLRSLVFHVDGGDGVSQELLPARSALGDLRCLIYYLGLTGQPSKLLWNGIGLSTNEDVLPVVIV